MDIHYWSNKGEKRLRKTPQVKIRVAMTDQEPVVKFATIFGGRVTGPYSYNGYKDFWIADVDSPPKAKKAAKAMWPHLSPRRRKQLEVIYVPV